jgi:hypothetical protein
MQAPVSYRQRKPDADDTSLSFIFVLYHLSCFFCGIRCIRLAAHAHFSLQRAAFAAVTPALGRIGAWL